MPNLDVTFTYRSMTFRATGDYTFRPEQGQTYDCGGTPEEEDLEDYRVWLDWTNSVSQTDLELSSDFLEVLVDGSIKNTSRPCEVHYTSNGFWETMLSAFRKQFSGEDE